MQLPAEPCKRFAQIELTVNSVCQFPLHNQPRDTTHPQKRQSSHTQRLDPRPQRRLNRRRKPRRMIRRDILRGPLPRMLIPNPLLDASPMPKDARPSLRRGQDRKILCYCRSRNIRIEIRPEMLRKVP